MFRFVRTGDTHFRMCIYLKTATPSIQGSKTGRIGSMLFVMMLNSQSVIAIRSEYIYDAADFFVSADKEVPHPLLDNIPQDEFNSDFQMKMRGQNHRSLQPVQNAASQAVQNPGWPSAELSSPELEANQYPASKPFEYSEEESASFCPWVQFESEMGGDVPLRYENSFKVDKKGSLLGKRIFSTTHVDSGTGRDVPGNQERTGSDRSSIRKHIQKRNNLHKELLDRYHELKAKLPDKNIDQIIMQQLTEQKKDEHKEIEISKRLKKKKKVAGLPSLLPRKTSLQDMQISHDILTGFEKEEQPGSKRAVAGVYTGPGSGVLAAEPFRIRGDKPRTKEEIISSYRQSRQKIENARKTLINNCSRLKKSDQKDVMNKMVLLSKKKEDEDSHVFGKKFSQKLKKVGRNEGLEDLLSSMDTLKGVKSVEAIINPVPHSKPMDKTAKYWQKIQKIKNALQGLYKDLQREASCLERKEMDETIKQRLGEAQQSPKFSKYLKKNIDTNSSVARLIAPSGCCLRDLQEIQKILIEFKRKCRSEVEIKVSRSE